MCSYFSGHADTVDLARLDYPQRSPVLLSSYLWSLAYACSSITCEIQTCSIVLSVAFDSISHCYHIQRLLRLGSSRGFSCLVQLSPIGIRSSSPGTCLQPTQSLLFLPFSYFTSFDIFYPFWVLFLFTLFSFLPLKKEMSINNHNLNFKRAMYCGLNLHRAVIAERNNESESGVPCMSSDVMCDFI